MPRRKIKRRQKNFLRHFFKSTLKALLAFGLILFALITFWITTFNIPDLGSFESRKIRQSTKIYDRTGEHLLFELHDDERRTLTNYEDISRHVKNATIAIEDAEFYEHIGIRPVATFRAVFIQPLRGKGVQGGSTLTQQVVKNSLLTSERKVSRKIKEWVLAVKLEQELSKEEILAFYLNEIPYGGSIYGVEEASQNFFGVSASELTLAQSAYLAALPQAPTYYSPYGNNIEELETRKNLVLFKMLENNFITENEYQDALSAEVEFQKRFTEGIKAPHMVFYIEEYLEERYGRKAIEENGYKVISTIDLDLQTKAEEIVKEYALQNAENFNAENAALVAIDPKTGQILTMVGSRDYFDEEIDGQFNISLAHRQPGSTFKPFVYATAFNNGYTPETVVFDVPTQFSTTCTPDGEPLYANSECYEPNNYDFNFQGPITLREALAQSVNIPAIKTLYLAGLQDSLRTARDMGISSLEDVSRYGLTLVLGGGEVSLLDLTSAYSTFGNDGIKNPHTAILRIEDNKGNVIEEFEENPRRVLPAETNRLVTDILTDNVARTPAFGANSYLHYPNHDVAVKTGTTNDFRDAWIVGSSPTIAVGAWAGNNDNSPMEKKVAGFIIAPLWSAFMDEALETVANEQFIEPRPIPSDIKPVLRGIWEGGATYTIDTISGKLATEYTPLQTQKEIIIPEVHNILHWLKKSDPQGSIPNNPDNDSQYELWEYGVQKWALENGHNTSSSTIIIPTEYDDVHTESSVVSVNVTGLKSTYTQNERISFGVSSSAQIREFDVYVNDIFLASIKNPPYAFSFFPSEAGLGGGDSTIIRIVAFDQVYNKGEFTQTISIQ